MIIFNLQRIGKKLYYRVVFPRWPLWPLEGKFATFTRTLCKVYRGRVNNGAGPRKHAKLKTLQLWTRQSKYSYRLCPIGGNILAQRLSPLHLWWPKPGSFKGTAQAVDTGVNTITNDIYTCERSKTRVDLGPNRKITKTLWLNLKGVCSCLIGCNMLTAALEIDFPPSLAPTQGFSIQLKRHCHNSMKLLLLLFPSGSALTNALCAILKVISQRTTARKILLYVYIEIGPSDSAGVE